MSELKRILMFLLLVTCQVILEKKSFYLIKIHINTCICLCGLLPSSREEQPPERKRAGFEHITHRRGVRLPVKHGTRKPAPYGPETDPSCSPVILADRPPTNKAPKDGVAHRYAKAGCAVD